MMSAPRVKDVISFLAFGAIILFSVSHLAALTNARPAAHRTNLSMEVSDINGLVVGSNVLLRGVQIGKISNVGANVKSATIDFYIDARYAIPVDSEARLENLSALGESYINLIPHRDGGLLLRDGQRISTERTVQPASIPELASSVVRVLNQLDPRALQRIINEGNAALPDPATTLPNISRASTLLRNTVADMHGSGRQLLDNFQTLLENASWVGPVLTKFSQGMLATEIAWQDVTKVAPVLSGAGGEPAWHDPARPNEQPSGGGGAFIKYFYNLLGLRLQGFLDRSGADLKVLGEAMQPKLNDVAGALMNLDISQLLDNVLAAVPSDGTVTLHVVP